MQPTTRDTREAQARELLRALRARSTSLEYGWDGDMSVEAGLLLEGARFEFVQAMRLLTQISGRTPARRLPPGRTSAADASQGVTQPAVAAPALQQVEQAPEDVLLSQGAAASAQLPAMDDPARRFSIRLRSRVGMDFAAASIDRILLSVETPGQIEVIANVLALGGQNGPLPEPYAEMLMQRQRGRDMAMADFLDIFHHRLLELYYTTTLHMAPWLEWRHPAGNHLAQLLFAAAGLGPADLRDQMLVPDRVWLRYAGLLWHRPRSAVGFERVVADHFKVRARLGQATGRWLPIEPEDLSRLNRETCRLGSTATLGDRVWLREAAVRLTLGPMDWPGFRGFLPDGDSHAQLGEMGRFYFDGEVRLDLELHLRAGDAQAAALGSARLGWTSWVRPAKGSAPLRLRLRHRAAGRRPAGERSP